MEEEVHCARHDIWHSRRILQGWMSMLVTRRVKSMGMSRFRDAEIDTGIQEAQMQHFEAVLHTRFGMKIEPTNHERRKEGNEHGGSGDIDAAPMGSSVEMPD